jgi:predicted acyltransferase (DUF342 family)
MPSALYVLAAVALVAAVVPFIPGWIELRRGKDRKALHINMDYKKSPFFFGDRLAELLRNGLQGTVDFERSDESALVEPQEYTVMLSHPEKVSVVTASTWAYEADARVSTVVYAAGSLLLGERSHFSKEILVEGDAMVGEGSRLRAVLCSGQLKLGAGASVTRWIDVRGGTLFAAAGCRLGRNAASSAMLYMERGCRFSNLYGAPVRTCSAPVEARPVAEGNIRETALVGTLQLLSIPMGAELRTNIVAAQNLKICAGATIHGDIKGHREVELEDNVTVYGTIVGDRKISLGRGCRIVGNVFAQGDIRIGNGTSVGEEGHVKSVVSRSAIYLEPNVTVYGYVTCEKGQVAEE